MSTSPKTYREPLRSAFERLRHNKNELLLLDGGIGEELFRQGVPDDRKLWSATAVVHPKYHSTLCKVHNSFLEAGSDAITTNSYGIVPGVGFSRAEMAVHGDTAGRLARKTVNDSQKTTSIVLGSLGPLIESYRPDKILPHNEGTETYRIMIEALSPSVDCFLAETMSSFEESAQAVQAVSECSRLPILVSYTLESKGDLRSGEPVVQGIRKLLDFSKKQNVDLLGVLFNCAEPEAITIALNHILSDAVLNELLSEQGVILGAYANRLTPVPDNWTMADSEEAQPMRNDLGPERYHEFVSKWRGLGVQIVGGCCGITPEHIAYMRSHLF